jgi:uncharacterized protein (TIGR03437 family)
MRILTLLLIGSLGASSVGTAFDTRLTQNSHSVGPGYVRSAVRFEANRGQFAPGVRYVARGAGATVFLTDDGATTLLRTAEIPDPRLSPHEWEAPPVGQSTTLQMTLSASEVPVRWVPGEPAVGEVNYHIGNNPDRWLTGVPNYGSVTARGVYPGIDLVWRENGGLLEYDFVVAPGADPDVIRLAWDGAEELRLNGEGDLVLATALGDVIQKRPRIFQDIAGQRVEVAGAYRLLDDSRAAFDVAAYNRNVPLIIDPEVVFSSAFGGGDSDTPSSVEMGPDGKLYVVGFTASTDLPVENELYLDQGNFDGYLAVFDTAGQLELLTYLGGSKHDYITGVGVGVDGKVHLAGYTLSSDFPVTDESIGGTTLMDAYYTVLRPDEGSLALEYSTYLAGNGGEWAYALSLVDNQALVSGITMTTTPVGFYQAEKIGSCSGVQNGFAALFTDAGGGVYSRDWVLMIGGSARDGIESSSISTHPDDESRLVAAFGGYAASTDIPAPTTTSSALTKRALAAEGAMLAIVDLADRSLLGLSYLSKGDDHATPWVKLHPDGSLLFGTVYSTQDAGDTAVVGVRSGDGELTYQEDIGPGRLNKDFVHDPVTAQIYGVGWADWRNTAASQGHAALDGDQLGGADGFIAVYSDSTFERLDLLRLGGSGFDIAWAVAGDGQGSIFVAGSTRSTDFPTATPSRTSNDVFLTKVAFIEGPPKPSFTAAGVVNSASYAGGTVAPTEIVTIYGQNLGPLDLMTMELTPDNLFVAKSLGGTRVLFDDVPSPMVYTWENVVSAIVPMTVAGKRSVNARIERDGVLSDPVQVQVTQCVPGIFTINASGTGQAAVRLWPDYSINGPSNPAARGGVIMAFATAGGLTNPPGEDGQILAAAAAHNLPIRATVGGIPATVSYGGGAPFLVNGVLQVNINIPDNAPTGDAVPLVITVGGVESQPGVTIAIQ